MSVAPSGTGAGAHARDSRPLLLCLSHLRWDFVFQRPQHLMSRAVRNHEVLFMEEPILQPGITESRLDLRSTPEGVTVAVPVLREGTRGKEAAGAQRTLLDGLLASEGGRPLVAWYYTPMALEFADHLAPDVTVYDCMDELSAFRGAPPGLLRLEQLLLDRADLVFTGGRSLHEAKRGRHPRVFCLPSSIDADHFRRAGAPQPEPADQQGIPRPRVGFFGVVDERMDLGLVRALAAGRPDWRFVMIGPVVKIAPESLPRLPNLHWLGPKPYAELPAYLSGWDAGFMPFALNESTRFISPTKTPEFLAAGLPVVSTPVLDVVRDWGEEGLVDIAGGPAAFAAALARVLNRPRAEWLRRVERRLAGISWDRTWEEMRLRMSEAERAGAAAGAVRGSVRHV
jgi:glycosyltransferase involved in cell wall biosynthesis